MKAYGEMAGLSMLAELSRNPNELTTKLTISKG
jgi:hypothetical protein